MHFEFQSINEKSLCDNQALTGSDFQFRVGLGTIVNLEVGLSGNLSSGSDKFSEVNWPS